MARETVQQAAILSIKIGGDAFDLLRVHSSASGAGYLYLPAYS